MTLKKAKKELRVQTKCACIARKLGSSKRFLIVTGKQNVIEMLRAAPMRVWDVKTS